MPHLNTSAYEVPTINIPTNDSGVTPHIMAEEGGHAPTGGNNHNPASDNQHHQDFTIKPRMTDFNSEELRDTMSPTGPMTPNPFSRKNTSIDIDDYFTGPRDILKHSKWPLFMQMHGSILPKMIVPLIWMSLWAAAITVIDKYRTTMGVDSVLLTVLGFVVGLGLSFRSSTAYERYAEGRRYWAQLILATQSLGRVFWIHGGDNEGIDPRQSLLRKVGCMNLLLAFSVSLKHKLRFEPYTQYEDLEHLVSHMTTFAQEATSAEPEKMTLKKKNFFKETGEYLGVSFAASNPRKTIKKASRPLGNLPLEILSHISCLVDKMVEDGQLKVPMQQTLAYNNVALLNDIMTGTERVLTTPLPIAYAIAISQITWVYVMLLPFQLIDKLGWITIPATVAASYIILGILFIGREIENPFGEDVNDLPLEVYCEQVASELDIIASFEKRDPYRFMESSQNLPLFPASMAPYHIWMGRSENRVREAIKSKHNTVFEFRKKVILEKVASRAGNTATEKKPSSEGTTTINGDHNV
ncbi:hypothetical protein CABS01_04018 [Colletotrichum abscissum]|uniref:Uncharacterized protein n=8 Tax=Colletotrichum acutatum species complex TaxID=2707335 RepID=A0A9P9X2N5_9PEZI|nr:uncharacterized protein CLUP02_01622 [Colletotrichum lupini]XP_060317826.1 uncharacterized protein CCOS01_03375 [Colletotrichum costaricense]XP_060382183.1 uncharacterized protein CTAM01_07027 [Colletotrichum tamarilloi]XP_060391648.1 uncharacterized protein CABS01_04018 [Colletotrichum abscissum]KAI3529948.1 hypothetical protein CSPX01_15171 [Colletotrichum filicis]KAK0373763.1 hypothetical protein CLIM01_08874 [Colletotrichum limetticola]KAK1459784.1 hypothetical protein CMEL01_02783 [Co